MKIVSKRGHVLTYEQLDDAATIIANHLMEVRDAISILYAAILQVPTSSTLTLGSTSTTTQGLIDPLVHQMLVDRLWDIHTHAEDGLQQARSIVNA